MARRSADASADLRSHTTSDSVIILRITEVNLTETTTTTGRAKTCVPDVMDAVRAGCRTSREIATHVRTMGRSEVSNKSIALALQRLSQRGCLERAEGRYGGFEYWIPEKGGAA